MKFDPSRREFLKKSLLVTGSGLFVPAFLRQVAWAAPAENDRFLVVIRLSGGNDGLNTVVPYRNDIYYRERPQIAVNQSDVLKLNDDQALHPALKNLHKQYERGNVGIFNSVGYPNPDRSHFRATDIWETASGADEYLQNGWLGRWWGRQSRQCR